MAQVTVELRNLLKTDFKLFDFEYDFDDQSFAESLEQAVIDFYYNYEIGQETPQDFKRAFKRRWLSLIGHYNRLHNTTLLEYNPLTNYKLDEHLEELSNRTYTEEEQGQETSSEQGEGSEKRTDDLTSTDITEEKTSDYPQQSIDSGSYLSGARKLENETNNTGTTKNESGFDSEGNVERTNTRGYEGADNRQYEKKIEGITGITYQELVQKERENLIRITGMVIEELKPCFILVY